MNLFRQDLPLARPGRTAAIVGGALTVAVLAYCAMLWPEWTHNPDLSHGFLSPLVFVLLLKESRQLGPLRWVRPGGAVVAFQLLLGLVAVAIFALAGLFAASVGWSHSLVLFLLGAGVAASLFSGLLVLADERVRFLPFNWINLTAILLFLLVAPIPSGTYYRLTLALQAGVTGGVMEVLQFFGIPARQHGNVIELARATVGVEDACSGVRSLISCVYAGFFLAAWQVRSARRRLAVIALAPLLAIVMNLGRSLLLTLLANSGIDIAGAWHDATGYAVLGVTTIILAGFAVWLAPRIPPAPAPTPAPAPAAAVPAGIWPLAGSLLLVAALGVFYFVHSRPLQSDATPPPSLEALLPASATGWEVRTPTDLYQFSDVLQTTHLLQRTYLRPDAQGGTDLTVYVAYWPAGRASVSRVALHTPDACWPGSGWVADDRVSQHRTSPPLSGLALAPAEYRLFRTDRGFAQHVWFWHVFDGNVIDYRDPYSLPALLHIAWDYGFRRQGSQYFIRVSSNRPWSELEQEPLLRQIMANLKSAGL